MGKKTTRSPGKRLKATLHEQPPTGKVELRTFAEIKAAADFPESGGTLTPEQTQLELHELRVHQIELEMQKKQSLKAQSELEVSRDRLFDLYDLAPIGYCTISKKNLILDANLTIADLLGRTTSALVSQPISRYILPEDHDIYYLMSKQSFHNDESHFCELRMMKKNRTPFWVHLVMSAYRNADGESGYRVVISDINERKQLENELSEINRLLEHQRVNLQMIVENVLEGIIMCGLDGRLEKWNPAAHVMHGLNDKERVTDLAGFAALFELRDPLGKLLSPEELPIARIIRGERLSGVEIHIKRIGRDWTRILSYHGHIICNKAGESLLAVVMIRDITHFKEAEAKINDLALLPEQNPSPVLRIDHEGFLLYCNPASIPFVKQWGLKAGGRVPKEWNNIIHRSLADNKSHRQEVAANSYLFELTFVPVLHLKYVNVFAFDITDRKYAEESVKKIRDSLEIQVRRRTTDLHETMETLRFERQRFNNVLEMLPAYVVLLAPDFSVKFANRFFLERFGSPTNKHSSRHFFNRDKLYGSHNQSKPLETLLPQSREWAGPDNRYYDIYGFPFTDADGTLLIMEMGIDITDRKLAEAALIEANEMKLLGQLTSGVAHEVRNPLNGIMAIMGALAKELADDERFDPYINHLRNQVTRLSVLMEDLLALGTPLHNEKIQEISLVTLVERALATWLETLPPPKPQVQLVKPDPIQHCLVQADDSSLIQMVINLLENARNHSPAESEIVCSVYEDPSGGTIFSVSDNGKGIPAEILPKIFDPFFTTRKGGTGLGLSIVHRIVENHQGTITVLNNTDRPGATFKVVFRQAGK